MAVDRLGGFVIGQDQGAGGRERTDRQPGPRITRGGQLADQWLLLLVISKEPSPKGAFDSTQGRYGGCRNGAASASGRAR